MYGHAKKNFNKDTYGIHMVPKQWAATHYKLLQNGPWTRILNYLQTQRAIEALVTLRVMNTDPAPEAEDWEYTTPQMMFALLTHNKQWPPSGDDTTITRKNWLCYLIRLATARREASEHMWPKTQRRFRPENISLKHSMK